MDKNQIGVIAYSSFVEILMMSGAGGKRHHVNDDFNWEKKTIKKLKDWIKTQGLSVENAFKSLDFDFDGLINKNDLKRALIELLEFEEPELTSVRID
jgi:Ca2+-binding EF-hand superfamily protein